MATKEKKVTKAQMLGEFLAMIKVCYKGKARVEDGKIRLCLPKGEQFIIDVREV